MSTRILTPRRIELGCCGWVHFSWLIPELLWQDLRNIGGQVCNKHAIPWLADTCSFLDGDEITFVSYFHIVSMQVVDVNVAIRLFHDFDVAGPLPEHFVLRNSATALRLVDFWLKECQDSEPGNRMCSWQGFILQRLCEPGFSPKMMGFPLLKWWTAGSAPGKFALRPCRVLWYQHFLCSTKRLGSW